METRYRTELSAADVQMGRIARRIDVGPERR